MLAAAEAGEIDLAEVEKFTQERDRLQKLLQQMADEKIDSRLSELALAMREAVSVAVKLAQMSEWIEEAETATNADPSAFDEASLEGLASVTPDEAIQRLKVIC